MTDTTPPRDERDLPHGAPGERRRFLAGGAALGGGLATALPAGCTTARTSMIPGTVDTSGRGAPVGTGGTGGFTGPGILTEDQPIYRLPRDHAYHGGPFWRTNDFNEWHYITILGKDLDTGNDVSVFWVPLSQGWIQSEGRPLQNALFSFHDIKTGEFQTALSYYPGAFRSEGTAPDAKDFRFRYAMKTPDASFETAYTAADETWRFKGQSTVRDDRNAPYDLEFTSVVRSPGYVPAAYWGVESIGYDPLDRQNPETMFGLTYYYSAPRMETRGVLKLANRTVRFEGMGWFEHQWGNFRNTLQYRYFYGYGRLNNGDMFTWRQYYEGRGFTKPRTEVNRYQRIDGRTGRRFSAFGPSFVAAPTRTWTSPKTGQVYPWWGEMKTPDGTLYYGPSHPEQEGVGLLGGFIEGVIVFREGSPDGPVVGMGFCEIVDLDPSEGPASTRTLPENPALQWRPMPR